MSFPRYIHIFALDESRQFLTLVNFGGLLTFTSAEPNHMTVHEVVSQGPADAAFTIRSLNGKFWRRGTGGFMVADVENLEEASFFLPVQLPNSVTVLKATDDQLYLRRFTTNAVVDGYNAATKNIDIHSQMLVTAADEMVVILPPKMALLVLDDARRFLVNPDSDGAGAVTFTTTAMSRRTTHEVVKSPLDDGTVMIRSPNGFFWRRRADGYIIADLTSTPQTSDKECFFKAVRFQDVIVFLSMLDGRYLKRFTDTITDGYNAATASIDMFCQMLVVAVTA